MLRYKTSSARPRSCGQLHSLARSSVINRQGHSLLPSPFPRVFIYDQRNKGLDPTLVASPAALTDLDMNMDLPGLQCVRPVLGMEELQQVAWLRAQAYYEDDHSRFVESFKKKFARGEAESLQQRLAPSKNRVPLCECLVLLDEVSSQVVGCIDVRLPSSATCQHPTGVPVDDPCGCYLLNVVVQEERRGQGIGRTLMKAAMQRAVSMWSAERLYTHVAADNSVALGLYIGCGFKEHSVDTQALHQETILGKLLLLQATADVVREAE